MAVDLGILEKVRKLKERFSGPDAHEDARRQIADWEARIRQLSQAEEFFNFPATQEIYKALKERARSHMRGRLVKGMSPESMRVSDAQEEECRWMLSLFNVSYGTELESLESLISQEF